MSGSPVSVSYLTYSKLASTNVNYIRDEIRTKYLLKLIFTLFYLHM